LTRPGRENIIVVCIGEYKGGNPRHEENVPAETKGQEKGSRIQSQNVERRREKGYSEETTERKEKTHSIGRERPFICFMGLISYVEM